MSTINRLPESNIIDREPTIYMHFKWVKTRFHGRTIYTKDKQKVTFEDIQLTINFEICSILTLCNPFQTFCYRAFQLLLIFCRIILKIPAQRRDSRLSMRKQILSRPKQLVEHFKKLTHARRSMWRKKKEMSMQLPKKSDY